MRIWPLVAVLSLGAFVAVIILSSEDLAQRMGNLTVWSAAVFLATIVFALATVASAIACWRARTGTVRKGVRRFSMVVSAALLIAVVYLAYWNVIGLRTWS